MDNFGNSSGEAVAIILQYFELREGRWVQGTSLLNIVLRMGGAARGQKVAAPVSSRGQTGTGAEMTPFVASIA